MARDKGLSMNHVRALCQAVSVEDRNSIRHVMAVSQQQHKKLMVLKIIEQSIQAFEDRLDEEFRAFHEAPTPAPMDPDFYITEIKQLIDKLEGKEGASKALLACFQQFATGMVDVFHPDTREETPPASLSGNINPPDLTDQTTEASTLPHAACYVGAQSNNHEQNAAFEVSEPPQPELFDTAEPPLFENTYTRAYRFSDYGDQAQNSPNTAPRPASINLGCSPTVGGSPTEQRYLDSASTFIVLPQSGSAPNRDNPSSRDAKLSQNSSLKHDAGLGSRMQARHRERESVEMTPSKKPRQPLPGYGDYRSNDSMSRESLLKGSFRSSNVSSPDEGIEDNSHQTGQNSTSSCHRDARSTSPASRRPKKSTTTSSKPRDISKAEGTMSASSSKRSRRSSTFVESYNERSYYDQRGVKSLRK